MHILLHKMTSNFSTTKKCIWFLPVQRPPGGLQLLNLETYPKTLKTWENLSYKNDSIPNNLSYQSKDKAYRYSLSKLPPPSLINTEKNRRRHTLAKIVTRISIILTWGKLFIFMLLLAIKPSGKWFIYFEKWFFQNLNNLLQLTVAINCYVRCATLIVKVGRNALAL